MRGARSEAEMTGRPGWRRTLGLQVLAASALLGAGTASPPDIATLRTLYAGPPDSWPAPTLHEGARFTEFGPRPPVKHPADNPPSPAKVALGERLFNDPKLSGSGQFACASCHNPELGLGDGLKTAFGHDRQRGRRNAPHLFAVAWQSSFFWDGRAASLEEQALMPIANPIEMAGDGDVIVERLYAVPDYRADFAKAFGDESISLERIAQALATFERTLKPRSSLWDRALERGTGVFNDQQLLGLHLFRTKAGCANCHSGPLFTDDGFHNIGLTYYGRKLEDLGRFTMTGVSADVGRFKTPSLRGLSRTGPYMHNGVMPRLQGVVAFYNGGGANPRPTAEQADDPKFPRTDPLLKPLDLSREEQAALVAFLETL